MDRALRLSRAGKILILQPELLSQQHRGFLIGTYYLLQGSRTYLNIVDGDARGMYWYPEYGFDLGAPLAGPGATMAAYDSADGVVDQVYRRDFTAGRVVVNGADAPRVITTGPGQWQRCTGAGGGSVAEADIGPQGSYVGGSPHADRLLAPSLLPRRSGNPDPGPHPADPNSHPTPTPTPRRPPPPRRPHPHADPNSDPATATTDPSWPRESPGNRYPCVSDTERLRRFGRQPRVAPRPRSGGSALETAAASGTGSAPTRPRTAKSCGFRWVLGTTGNSSERSSVTASVARSRLLLRESSLLANCSPRPGHPGSPATGR
jgi:hypothetical protein